MSSEVGHVYPDVYKSSYSTVSTNSITFTAPASCLDPIAYPILDIILSQTIAYLDAKRVDLWWMNRSTNAFEYLQSISKGNSEETSRQFGPYCLYNLPDPGNSDEMKPGWSTSFYICGRPMGLIRIFFNHPTILSVTQSEFIASLSEKISLLIRKDGLIKKLETLALSGEDTASTAFENISQMIDSHNQAPINHTKRVVNLVSQLAEKLGLSSTDIQKARRGAAVHGIGQIGIPDLILRKAGALSQSERHVINLHPLFALKLLSGFETLSSNMEIPVFHHERWNGQGYPFGLSGDNIPLQARIFSIVDVWDALTRIRPYRDAFTAEEAKGIILAEKGKAFQPEITDAFIEMVSAG